YRLRADLHAVGDEQCLKARIDEGGKDRLEIGNLARLGPGDRVGRLRKRHGGPEPPDDPLTPAVDRLDVTFPRLRLEERVRHGLRLDGRKDEPEEEEVERQ